MTQSKSVSEAGDDDSEISDLQECPHRRHLVVCSYALAAGGSDTNPRS